MGLSAPLLDMHIGWAKEGLLRSGTSVLDIGAQELFCAEDPAALNRFVTHFGAEPIRDVARMATGYCGDLFTRAGFVYRSIDIVPGPHVLRMDLNADVLPREQHGRYHWIANHGTSEHILNQWNVFKTMHDACAEGGVMYHNVPMVEPLHGIFSYSPRFFESLAAWNGYKILRTWAWSSEEPTDLRGRFGHIPFNGPAPAAFMWINMMLRREDDRPFRGVSDCIPESA